MAQQLVHGYKGGHRLLAGSASLAPDVLRLIDRLSDAAGPQISHDLDGYLTGYPLPGGDYALAMTWPAPEAIRPNVVWTHTLVLPPSALSAASLQPLIDLFRRPASLEELDSYAVPVPLVHGNAHPWPVFETQGVSKVVAALYGDSSGAWLTADGASAELCLAIWSQQWPRLRRAFSFCAGASEPRQLDNKGFDLLLAPHGHRIKTPASKGDQALDDRTVQALVEDLATPGPLRKFFRACGPDSGQLRSVTLLTNVWLNARYAEDPTRVLTEVVAQAPEPGNKRRLKRELLRGAAPLLAMSDPVLTLRCLASQDIGRRILADDADVVTWTDRAWGVDRTAVLHAMTAATAETENESSTAAGATQGAVRSLLRERTSALDLAWLVDEAPELAAEALAQHSEPDWWHSWAALAQAQRRRLTPFAVMNRTSTKAACAALLEREDGPSTWVALHNSNAAFAIGGLLNAAAETDQPLSLRWQAAIGAFGREVLSEVREGLSPQAAAVAADLAPHSKNIAGSPLDLWRPLAAERHLWADRPVRAALLLRAALAASGTDADVIAGEAFAKLHKAFSEQKSGYAWDVIQPTLPGQSDDWDRCRRLEEGVAKVVASKRGLSRAAIRSYVPPGAAREALDAAVARRRSEVAKRDRPKGPLDDLFNLFRQ